MHAQSTVVGVASSSSSSQRANTRRPLRVARLLLHPSQARSSFPNTSRRRAHQPMTRDGGAHAVHGYTRRYQAPKPDLEAGRAHAIYSRRRCLIFLFLAGESEHPSPTPRRAPLAPSDDEPCQARATAPPPPCCFVLFDCSLEALRTPPRVSAAPPPKSNPTRVPNLSSMTGWWKLRYRVANSNNA